MDTRCARCDAPMSCNPAGDCWCKELPHGPMPVKITVVARTSEARPSQDGARRPGTVETSGSPQPELAQPTGCLCRDCLEQDLRAQGLLDQEAG